MRKVQKILLVLFVLGVLLTGVGTGVALIEYSSLAYGGTKTIGEEHLITKTLSYEISDKTEEVILLGGYKRYIVDVTEVIEDAMIPENEIRYVVTYNEKRIKPYIWTSEADSNDRVKDPQLKIGLEFEYLGNEFEEFMMVKDEVLSDLKNGRISEYEIQSVSKVLIQVNPDANVVFVQGGQ